MTDQNDTRPEWSRLHLWQIQPVRDVLLFFAVFGLLLLGQKISLVTVPLLLALLFAYLLEPVVSLIQRKTNWSRQPAVGAVLGGVILFIIVPAGAGLTYGVAQGIGLVSELANNVRLVAETMPENELPPGASAEDELDARSEFQAAHRDKIESQAGKGWAFVYEQLHQSKDDESRQAVQWMSTQLGQISASAAVSRAAGVGVGAVKTVVGIAGSVFAFGFGAFLTAFFFFFISSGWVEVKDFGVSLIPEKYKDQTTDLVGKFDNVISSFIRGRLTIAFIQAIVFTLGYWLMGVPAAFVLGPVIAIFSIVPYLALVGIPISITLLWLEGHTGFKGEWWWIIGAPVAFYFFVQALDDYILTPMIQGKGTDMSTPLILFSSLAGGALFGVFGLLIAIPIAACLKIVLQEIFWPKFREWADGRRADMLPIE